MKRKTPSWAILTGIFMMLVGGCGIKNDIQSINIKELVSLQKTIFASAKKEKIENRNQDTSHTEVYKDSINVDSISESPVSSDSVINKSDNNPDFGEIVENLFDIPDHVMDKMIVFGYIGLFFSFLYILGGLFLMVIKKFSIKLAYYALGGNILFSIVKWITLSGDDVNGIAAISSSLSNAFFIFISIVLGVVIVSCDQSEYEEYIEE